MKSVPLYGAETWRINVNIISKVQTFINTCLRKVLWPNAIRNRDLLHKTSQLPVQDEITRRRWIGHTLRKPISSPDLESSRKEEKSKAKKHLAPSSRGQAQDRDG